MSDTTFLPGPNLRIASNDSGMSYNGISDKVDLHDPSSYTEDVHTNSDGSQVRVQRAKPAPLPENATLQDRLRRYSPINGYAKYCAMAADKIDEQAKELHACRNLNMELNTQVTAYRIENEKLHEANTYLLRQVASLSRLNDQAMADRMSRGDDLIKVESQLSSLRNAGLFTRIYNAIKGNKY
jgi:exonuclease VII large subunit